MELTVDILTLITLDIGTVDLSSPLELSSNRKLWSQTSEREMILSF